MRFGKTYFNTKEFWKINGLPVTKGLVVLLSVSLLFWVVIINGVIQFVRSF